MARPALRLGLRQIDGLQEDEVKKLVAARVRPSRVSPEPLHWLSLPGECGWRSSRSATCTTCGRGRGCG